jgi:6-phosphofructokinase 1
MAATEIDKIRDTAVSLERIFILEFMGRTRGFLALNVGFTVGAERILVPELKHENKKSSEPSKMQKKEEKKSAIIVAAEGIGDNRQLANESEKATSAEVKLSVLGYKQRGGNPSARSRLLANLFSDKAVELLSEGQRSEAFALRNGEITSIGLEESFKTEKPLDLSLLNLASILAT